MTIYDGTHCGYEAPPHDDGSGQARTDPVGDFLSVYTGPLNGDLDVVFVDAFLSGPDEVVLVGTHAAPIGTTPGAAYVWGVDRGAGIELLAAVDPPTGEGVTFDAVVLVLPDGTGSVIDLAGGGPPQPLDPSGITIDGATISATVPRSLLPSQGLDFADYGYNLWPRFALDGVNPGDNTQVSDLAPNASIFTARPQIVPEPEPVDWNTLAEQVQANFAASGAWYL